MEKKLIDNINQLISATNSRMESDKSLRSLINDSLTKINKNFEVLQGRIEKIENKIDILDSKLEGLGKETHSGLQVVGEKILDLKTEIQKIGEVTGYEEEFVNLRLIR